MLVNDHKQYALNLTAAAAYATSAAAGSCAWSGRGTWPSSGSSSVSRSA